MSDIKLNYIDQSNDSNNSDVVIFQKNVATSFDELAVAWTVIKNTGQGSNHPFTFPSELTVGAADSWGNFTPQLAAENGQLFSMVQAASGNELQYTGPGTSPTEIQIQNSLAQGAISANVYRAGRLLATKTNIAPGQKAVFQFKPTIFIGVASEVTEGEVLNSAIISSVNTEISLLGIASADIVMTGGGTGPNATPFVFQLENIVMS